MSKTPIGAVALLGVGLAIPFAGASAYYQLGTQETERFTLIKAEEVYSGQGSNATKQKRINVILENGCPQTFTVDDSLWNGQFRSLNLFTEFSEAAEAASGNVDARKTFEATHYGWRWGLMSWLENVVEAEQLPNEGPYTLRPNASQDPICRM